MSTGIRTLEHLQDAMSREFAWRKKELHGLKVLIIKNETASSRDLYIRAAVTLLYAHWEGFVKQLGGYYLEFVARKQLKYEQLPRNFLAMAIGKIVRKASDTSRIDTCLEVVDFFRMQMTKASQLIWQNGINTRSNLKSAVFRDIVNSLGLDYRRFELKEKLIDEKLLRNRNQIAHGEYLLVDFDEYLELHDEMIAIMQDWYNQIENSAFTGAYKTP